MHLRHWRTSSMQHALQEWAALQLPTDHPSQQPSGCSSWARLSLSSFISHISPFLRANILQSQPSGMNSWLQLARWKSRGMGRQRLLLQALLLAAHLQTCRTKEVKTYWPLSKDALSRGWHQKEKCQWLALLLLLPSVHKQSGKCKPNPASSFQSNLQVTLPHLIIILFSYSSHLTLSKNGKEKEKKI